MRSGLSVTIDVIASRDKRSLTSLRRHTYVFDADFALINVVRLQLALALAAGRLSIHAFASSLSDWSSEHVGTYAQREGFDGIVWLVICINNADEENKQLYY